MFRVVIRLLGTAILLLVLLVVGFMRMMRAYFPDKTLDAQREWPRSE